VGDELARPKDFDEVIDAARAEVLPFESWERLPAESGAAYGAFCVFRDFGADRNIKRALATLGWEERKQRRAYNVWRNWSTLFQWSRRAGEYDLYLDRLKRAERAKSIEAREGAYRAVTEKMLAVVEKRLDLMKPEELTQGNIVEWMRSAIDVEREVLGAADAEGGEPRGNPKQLEIRFTTDFEGL
jgi:hypothetical protein